MAANFYGNQFREVKYNFVWTNCFKDLNWNSIYTSLQANFLMYCHRGNLNYNYIIKKWIPIIYTQYTKSLLLHLELSFLSLIFKLTYIHAQHNIINVASSSIYFRLGMTFLANWEKESWISSVTKFDGFRTMHAISKITSS